MERIAATGLSIHETGVVELERVATACAGNGVDEGLLRELADALAASELVVVQTCNRIEVVFGRESGAPPSSVDRRTIAEALGIADDRLRRALFFHRGRAAVRHVFRVASSLESLVVGEDQILGQVRGAHVRSRGLGLAAQLLDPLFEAAVQVGKEVRTRTDLSRHPISVVALGVRALRDEFADTDEPPRIAVVGAGQTGRLAGHALRGDGWPVAFVVNRSVERADRLARDLGARALSLDEFLRGREPVDVIVSATSAPGPVFTAADLKRVARNGHEERAKLLGIDLAVPRDLEPVDEEGFRLIDLDALRELAEENRRLRQKAAARAEAIVERKLATFGRALAERRVTAIAGEVLSETSEILEHELLTLPAGRLEHLSDEDRRLVERWARRTFGRLAHAPLAACKRLAHELCEVLEEDEEETTG